MLLLWLNATITAKNLAPFLIKFLTELSEGNTFYDDIYSVIEGTHIDFEQIMSFLQSKNIVINIRLLD